MNEERPDEREAKCIVEGVLGVPLDHADKLGGVDYLSLGGRHAVEVTRVTDGRRRAGRDALRTSRPAGELAGELRTCWLTFVADAGPKLKTFEQRVHPALVELEQAGETSFGRQCAAVQVFQRGPLSHIYRPLIEAGVEYASAMPSCAHPRSGHRVIPTLGSDWTFSGSDQALSLLTDALAEKPDNAKKLLASGADHQHLFVWIDADTRFDIARPLSHEAPSWSDGFDLPSTRPALDPEITHLWVVHQGSGMGWLWDGQVWQALRDRTESFLASEPTTTR